MKKQQKNKSNKRKEKIKNKMKKLKTIIDYMLKRQL